MCRQFQSDVRQMQIELSALPLSTWLCPKNSRHVMAPCCSIRLPTSTRLLTL